jgi:large subunit ribosomal protein L1
MQKEQVLKALKEAKAESKKRNFNQSIDLIINLKGLDLKKNEEQVDNFVQLHYSRGRKIKICALVGAELKDEAEKNVDKTILSDDFETYAKDKRLAKKLAREYDYFIGQANIMPKIAQTFGKTLGTKGRMPNPKAGCIVPPKTNFTPLVEKLQKQIRVQARTSPVVHAGIGAEDMEEKEVVDNILTVYNSVISSLKNGEHNIKSVFLKTTMGKAVRVD